MANNASVRPSTQAAILPSVAVVAIQASTLPSLTTYPTHPLHSPSPTTTQASELTLALHSGFTSSAPPPPEQRVTQKRRPITETERKILRDYHFKENRGKTSHKALIQWYEQTYYRKLNQSTISESLGSKFVYLDMREKAAFPAKKRQQEAVYPDLEEALFEWQQKHQQ